MQWPDQAHVDISEAEAEQCSTTPACSAGPQQLPATCPQRQPPLGILSPGPSLRHLLSAPPQLQKLECSDCSPALPQFSSFPPCAELAAAGQAGSYAAAAAGQPQPATTCWMSQSRAQASAAPPAACSSPEQSLAADLCPGPSSSRSSCGQQPRPLPHSAQQHGSPQHSLPVPGPSRQDISNPARGPHGRLTPQPPHPSRFSSMQTPACPQAGAAAPSTDQLLPAVNSPGGTSRLLSLVTAPAGQSDSPWRDACPAAGQAPAAMHHSSRASGAAGSSACPREVLDTCLQLPAASQEDVAGSAAAPQDAPQLSSDSGCVMVEVVPAACSHTQRKQVKALMVRYGRIHSLACPTPTGKASVLLQSSCMAIFRQWCFSVQRLSQVHAMPCSRFQSLPVNTHICRQLCAIGCPSPDQLDAGCDCIAHAP